MRIYIILVFLCAFLVQVHSAEKELPDPLDLGPASTKYPMAKWGARCYDSDAQLEYWFGGSGGDSKTGPLFTYVFKDGKWQEIQIGTEEQLQQVADFRKLETEMRRIYAAIANRYYRAETEAERKVALNERCNTLIGQLNAFTVKIQRTFAQDKLKAEINALETLAEKLNNALSIKEVAESRRIYRALAQVRMYIDVQPSPRAYASMTYDSQSKKIILFGGEGIFGVYADTWVFDTQKKTWEPVFPKQVPPPRCAHAMIAHDGMVYVCGGFKARGSLAYVTGLWMRMNADVWRYSVKENTWTAINRGEESKKGERFQPIYTATINPDENKLSWHGDVIVYRKVKATDSGTIPLPGNDIGTAKLAVAPDTIQIRGSGFDPAWYEAVPEPDESTFQNTLKNLAVNKWTNVAPPVKHVRRDWGTTVLDIERDQLLHWAGGHSSHCGTDVAHYSLRLNRWHIAQTPELPFEYTYSNDGAQNPTLSGRPWGSHTYLSYALDSVTGKMIWAGKHRSYTHTNPTWAFIYDPAEYEWTASSMKFETDDIFDVERHKTCMVPTPHGIVCWGDKRIGGQGGLTGIWLADLKNNTYKPIAATNKKEKSILPNASYGDRQGICYDSKRDQVLMFHFKLKEKFQIWRCDLKTKKIDVLTPEGSTEFPMAADMGREATYIPDYDVVYIPSRAGKGVQVDLIYDIQNNRWLQMPATYATDKKGKFLPAYGVSTGIEWDAKRKLLWLVQTDGSVYAMPIDLASLLKD